MDKSDIREQHDAQQLAEACREAMYRDDYTAQALGIGIERVGPGYAMGRMEVRRDMVNSHRICHGGMTFALADTLFAYACNAYNRATVASGCSIEYLAPAFLGDILTAEAVERSLSGRTGVYDITVSRQNGEVVALFRGKSYRIRGEVIGAGTAPETAGA